MSQSDYLFANQAPEAGDRFDALAALFDPVTFRHLEQLGVADGWRCLEVGAGGGSVAQGLADRVGTSGHVLATDLDVRWLEERLDAPNIEVRSHNLVTDPLPEGHFDVAHERLVLIHVPERVEALRHLVSCLRPGGWLLAEDFDSVSGSDWFIAPDSEDEALGDRIVHAVRTLLAQRGADTSIGHKLPKLLRDAGLEAVGADAYQVIADGDAVRELLRANIVQVGDDLIRQELIARDELTHFITRLDDGAVSPSSPLMVSAWGKRPVAAD